MFVDTASVKIKAGDGGNGAVSFRREKFVDKGGPDGGDGGDGGDVVFVASLNQNTLANFRHQKELKAQAGAKGSKQRQHGKSGKDLEVKVPVGTVVFDQTGKTLADLTQDGQSAVVAKGGKGGFGNAHFTSSTRQAPRVAEKGEPGQKLTVTLELKMIADVGLVGLPNAGKSTLLSVVSNASPAVDSYPFTTLVPHLGVVDVDKSTSLLFADIPGLIEGASKGKGLGGEFLRHIERNQMLVHLIDIYQKDLARAYKTIQTELKNYKKDLSKLPQIVVLTKIDGLDEENIQTRLKELKKTVKRGTKTLAISAQSHEGIDELLFAVKEFMADLPGKSDLPKKAPIPIVSLGTDQSWQIKKSGQKFIVSGGKPEQFALRTDFEDFYGRQRLYDILNKMGVLRELEKKGIKPGQKIQIGSSTKQTLDY